MNRDIEYWQQVIRDYSTKWGQTRRIGNRNRIIVRRCDYGWHGHFLELVPTGRMEGKRFIGDPDQPFHFCVYGSHTLEHGTVVDPIARTYTITDWMWSSSLWIHSIYLPGDLRWRFRFATRYVRGGVELAGNYEGPTVGYDTDPKRIVITTPREGLPTITNGRPVRTHLPPEEQPRQEMRQIRAQLWGIIAPYESMRASAAASEDHPTFGRKAILEVGKGQPDEERLAEVLEMLNHSDELYVPGYQHLLWFGLRRRWRGYDAKTALDAFMQRLKRQRYTTIQSNEEQ